MTNATAMHFQQDLGVNKGIQIINIIVCSENQSSPRCFCISEYITDTSKGMEEIVTYIRLMSFQIKLDEKEYVQTVLSLNSTFLLI